MINNPESQEYVNGLKAKMVEVLVDFTGDVNDEETRQNVVLAYKDLLDPLPIHSYYVKCDEINNTPETIAANELWVEVGIQVKDTDLFTRTPICFGRAAS